MFKILKKLLNKGNEEFVSLKNENFLLKQEVEFLKERIQKLENKPSKVKTNSETDLIIYLVSIIDLQEKR